MENPRSDRPSSTQRSGAAVRLVKTILELDRRGVRGALFGSCPLLGANVQWEKCARSRLAKLSTEALLTLVHKHWEDLL